MQEIKDSIWQTYNSLCSSVYEDLDEEHFIDVLIDAWETTTDYKNYDPNFVKSVAREIYKSDK